MVGPVYGMLGVTDLRITYILVRYGADPSMPDSVKVVLMEYDAKETPFELDDII